MAPGVCLSYDPHRRQRGKGIPTMEMPIIHVLRMLACPPCSLRGENG